MPGTSAGLKKGWAPGGARRTRYGKSGVRPEVRAARAAGTFQKQTVAILDKPFRLSGLTPGILREWRSARQEEESRADKIIQYWLRHARKSNPARYAAELEYLKVLNRHIRQYRRAIETGREYLEKNGGRTRKDGR